MTELDEIRRRKLKERMNKMRVNEIEVGEDEFKEKVLEKSRERPVLVDFWAPWCAPCLFLGPVLSKVAVESDAGVLLAKVNVDNAHSLAREHGIRGIPAVKLFKNGEEVAGFVGARQETDVRKWLGAALQ